METGFRRTRRRLIGTNSICDASRLRNEQRQYLHFSAGSADNAGYGEAEIQTIEGGGSTSEGRACCPSPGKGLESIA
jgi:hypothetical protein